MKIKRISLENFKCFEKHVFDLNSQFTLLVGDNGKGKTAILDALAISAGSFLQGISETRTRLIQNDEIRLKDFGQYIERQFPLLISAEGIVNSKKIDWERRLNSLRQGGDWESDNPMAHEGEMIAKKVRSGDKVNLPLIVHYGTNRLWLSDQKEIETQPKGSRLELGYKNCLNSSSHRKEFLSWIKTAEFAKIQKKKKNPALTAVKEAISNCVEEWDVIFFDLEEDDLVGYSTKGEKNQLPFRLLSDGVRNMIGMVADIAYRCVMLNPHLEEEAIKETEGIVLIDELDLHLHPSWQKRVVGDLKKTFPKIQFVASSHSPFIVQSLKSDELINLDGQTDMNFQDMGIEEISQTVMGIKHRKSKNFIDMEETATEYFKLVQDGVKADNEEDLKVIKEKLDELLIPFSEDPAFTAQLKMERLAKLGK